MTFESNGKYYNLRLTKHGRQRFIQRVGAGYSDTSMIALAYVGLPEYKFIWKPDRCSKDSFRLVTVLRVIP